MWKFHSFFPAVIVSFSLTILFLLIPSYPAEAAAIKAVFSVDVTKYVQAGVFNTDRDKVYLCGNFNNWDKSTEMTRNASGFVYSVSVQLEKYTYYEYKYLISSPGAPNGGLEDSVGAAGGKRFYNFYGFDKILPVDYFNNQEPSSEHITITSPANGESWPAGSTQNITWNSTGISNVKLEYTPDGGQSWLTIAASVPAESGKYSWPVPAGTINYEWRVRVSDAANPADVKYSSGYLVIYSNIASSVAPLLKVEYPVFTWPLNAYYPPTTSGDDEMINGRVGNACGPTVVANILRFWEFPRKGTGSRSFTDHLGCQWSADFQAANYEYDRMPKNIPSAAPESVYSAAATLMYHAGAGMHNVWRSGAQDGVVEAMHEYFNYSKKSKFLERKYYTPAQWDKVVKSELSAGRPLLSAGPGHWFIVDGYTSDNLFHVRWDYGEANDQYLPLYGFKPYEGNHWIFAYLEPELSGRRISLTSPNGGEYLKKNQVCNIKWESTGISNVQLEYSTDNGYNWTMFANNVPASSGSYSWIVNADKSDNYKVRISACDDINIYDRSDNTFSIYDIKELTLASPLNSYLQSGSIAPVRWRAQGISLVVLKYSADDGISWKNIGEFPAASGVLKWNVPDISASKCKIKLFDKSDTSFTSFSNSFAIGKAEPAGGPYAQDDNTAALLHFNNDFTNEYGQIYSGQSFNGVSFLQNFDLGLDYCVRIDNSGKTNSVVNIPDCNAVDLSNDWTIELWFKINSWGSGIAAYPYLLWKPGANYFIYLGASAKNLSAGFDYAGGSDVVSLPQNCLSPGKWYHVTFIRNTAYNILKCSLLDSTRQIIAAASAPFNPSHKPKITDTPVGIGGTTVPGNMQFDGYVDEVRISNKVRNLSSLSLLTSPGSGEKLMVGSVYNIQWSAASVLKVKLEYSTNNGQTWEQIISSINALQGSYKWTIPNSESEYCKIRISDQIDPSVYCTSNNVFTITNLSAAEKSIKGIPGEYILCQNFPNPFNPSTTISFGIPDAGFVSLVVYDMLGQKVKELVNEYRSAGYYNTEFNASQLPSGTYIYRLQSSGFSQIKKLILLK